MQNPAAPSTKALEPGQFVLHPDEESARAASQAPDVKPDTLRSYYSRWIEIELPLPPALAVFRATLERLVEITSRPPVSKFESIETRAGTHRAYRATLDRFDKALFQMLDTQRNATAREQ